jgi:hypothetical protein
LAITPVEPGALEAGEPVGGHGRVGGRRGEVDGCRHPVQRLLEEPPPLDERTAAQVVVPEGEQVEGDEAGGGRLGQERDARRRRVDAVEQGVEVEAAGPLMTISPSSTQRSGRLARRARSARGSTG